MSISRTGLLVSVRSAEEAESALAGGADLIDVKEPRRGSLGRADETTIAEVLRVVAGRAPVSAAMGELDDGPALLRQPGLAFAKWGLAGWQHRTTELEESLRGLAQSSCPGCRAVFVAYADWRQADSPPPEVLCQLARQWRMAAFVIDTYIKDGSTLLDWMPASRLAMLASLCHATGMQIALAGSLGMEEITALREVRPDWFAVRGAACTGGRQGAIDERRVRELKEAISLLQGPLAFRSDNIAKRKRTLARDEL